MKISSLNQMMVNQLTKNSLSTNQDFNKILAQANIDFEKAKQDMSKVKEKTNENSDNMFKTFDFMQIMNQLLYSNLTDAQKNKLMSKAENLAKS